MLTPEQRARQNIDQLLQPAGWIIQDHTALNLGAGRGIAVREFPLKTGFADYLLLVDRKAIGVVEAKAEGTTLSGVEPQSQKYGSGLPDIPPAWRKPLRARLRSLPPLIDANLWGAQIEAVTNLERSFADDRPRALIQMATGCGNLAHAGSERRY